LTRVEPTVLVIDDDRDLVRLMTKFLRIEGFTPTSASNGREALAYLQGGGDASVILLDLRMPVMDGWEFRAAQRADPRIAHIPVVVVTGMDAGPAIEALGAVATFQKPVSFADLVGTVRAIADYQPNA
jgi:two-component system, chemotaxis family, chemotaxis protein CheY